MKSSLKIVSAPQIWVPKRHLTVVSSMPHGRQALPWWAKTGKQPAAPVAPVPQPSDKTGMLWGLDPRTGVTFSSGINVSQVADASGGTNHTTFAAGKEAEYQASYLTTGKPALKLLSTTLGIYGTTNFIGVGADHGLYVLLHNVAEGGTYYHTFLSLRTSVANNNQNIVISNDPSYGTFGSILSGTFVVGNTGATATITAAPSALIWNYTGGVVSAAASYNSRLNNAALVLSVLAGGGNNNTNANQVNSYANSSPPQFPALNSYLLGAWLYDSPITNTEADTIFKPFAQSYNMVQA